MLVFCGKIGFNLGFAVISKENRNKLQLFLRKMKKSLDN